MSVANENPYRTCPEPHVWVVTSVYDVPYGDSGSEGTVEPSTFIKDKPDAPSVGSGDSA